MFKLFRFIRFDPRFIVVVLTISLVSLIFSFVPFIDIIGAVFAGFIAVYMFRIASVGRAALAGLIGGILSGVYKGIIVAHLYSSATAGFIAATIGMVIYGILALIGGVMGSALALKKVVEERTEEI